jgi:four helix bundle protein
MEGGFKSLVVWQKSMALADVVFHLTKRFPREELYGLTSQMRRAAISIPSNIAEGSRRSSKKDYVQFLRIACGSAVELETQLLLASNWYLDIRVK